MDSTVLNFWAKSSEIAFFYESEVICRLASWYMYISAHSRIENEIDEQKIPALQRYLSSLLRFSFCFLCTVYYHHT